MALESYRRQRVVSSSANADFDQTILLNVGDVDGRIVRFEAAKGNGRAATACKLWIDKGESLAVFCELTRVDMPTPTWEAAVPVKGLAVGTYNAAIRLEDVDGSITETMPLKVQVVGSILTESEATEEMQDALDDFEIRTNAALADIAEAITDAETATANANSATTSANSAAVSANTAAQNIGAEIDNQGILVVTNADGATTTYSGAATAAQSATSAAERATDAAISAETAAGNIGAEVDSSGIVTVTDADGSTTTFVGLYNAVLLARGAAERAGDAAVLAGLATNSANDAAIAANSAAESATEAAQSATEAAGTATEAATSATEAAASANDAASTATEAATAATDAATSANNAATSASDAATAATTAATNASTATANANSATTAANTAAQSATDAAAAALASVGNIVIGEMSMLDGSIETVDDAFVSPLRGIEVEGKSTQASVAGNQLYKPFSYTTTNHSVDAVTSLDGTITVSGTSNGNAYSIEVPDATAGGYYSTLGAGEYTLSGATTECPLQIVVDSVAKYNTTSTQTFTLEQQSNVIIRSFIASGRTVNTTVKPMLNAGATALPWEPYCGGIPSPNPDYPQPILSVAEAGQVITGRCVWGGEQMADDIVAAVGDSTKAYKGEDDHGKYVVVVGSVPVRGKIFFDRTKANSQYTFILHSKKNVANTGANLLFNYSDGTTDGIVIAQTAEEDVVYTYANVSRQGKSLTSVGGTWSSGTTYIYYEQSGLFEGVLSNDDFVTYLGTTAPLIPSGVEPLRSLPNGVHDELIVHEDGSREIVRRVGTVVFDESRTYGFYTSGGYDGIYSTVPDMSRGDRQSGLSDKCICALASRGLYAWLGVSNSVIYVPMLFNRTGIAHGDLYEWIAENPISFLYPLATPVIEPLPSITMPSAPSSDVTAWLESKDESSAPIATDSSIAYERSLQIVIDKLEQAIADL